MVHHETDERFWTSVGRSRSDRLLVIGSGSKTTTEYRVLDATDPTGEFRVVAPRRQGVEYTIDHAVIGGEDVLLVLHNDDAENYELAVAPLDATSHEQWTPLLPHDPAVRLEDVDAFATHLVVNQRSEGLTQLRVIELTDAAGASDGPVSGLGDDYLVEFEDPVYAVGSGGNPEFHQPNIRLGYTTLATPPTVYDFDVPSRTLHLRKRTPVLPHPEHGPFDPARYEQHRTWATAGDGTRVPVSLVVPAGSPRDGSTPVLLYGYGSYEDSIDPYFTIAPALPARPRRRVRHRARARRWRDGPALVRRGQAARQAQHLHRLRRLRRAPGGGGLDRAGPSRGRGRQRRRAADGRGGQPRAGGRSRASWPTSPFVDPLTTILDPSLPLTVIEWEEWGNPLDDPEVYAYMKAYSPYENVEPRRYPPILAQTSPARHPGALRGAGQVGGTAARGRARHRGLRCSRREMSAGHGGVSGRYNAWRERAFTLAWILDRLGRS